VKKERNLLTISFVDFEGTNVIDINTGTIFGKRGKPVKKLSHARLRYNWSDNNEKMWYNVLDRYAPSEYAKILPFVDKLLAVGLLFDSYDIKELADMKSLKLDGKLIKFLKENYNGHLSRTTYMHYQNLKKIKPENIEVYNKYYNRYNIQLNEDINSLLDIVRKLLYERLDTILSESTILELSKTYYQECKDLGIKPTPPKNSIKDFANTHIKWLDNRDEMARKRFANLYGKYPFETTIEDYSIIVPKSETDIVNEGEKLNHCVGSYVNDVMKNRLYIVFLRKTEEIDKPLITIQINENLKVGQVKGQSNRYAEDDEERIINLYREYLGTIAR
jgi:hypothetical protein